jgi:hypothetical protein
MVEHRAANGAGYLHARGAQLAASGHYQQVAVHGAHVLRACTQMGTQRKVGLRRRDSCRLVSSRARGGEERVLDHEAVADQLPAVRPSALRGRAPTARGAERANKHLADVLLGEQPQR